MRKQEEIIERFKAAAPRDPFGFESGEYLRALNKEALETLRGEFIKEDADLSEFEPDLTSDEAIRTQCIEYMDFAWQKANDCRGISAARSLSHYRAWLWLLGEDQFDDQLEDYEFYGKDELIKVCEFLDLDHKQWDDGVRTNG